MKPYLDDDENVIAMRQTARVIGLTALLARASRAKSLASMRTLLNKALRLIEPKQGEK